MMVGKNELCLNEATMMQAVQYWLNAQFVNAAPVVKGVQADREGHCDFIVELESPTVQP